ncbi:MAG TPA: DUF5107 domain-containing protein [Bryobacteraceae bacterium]|nr:DUF5107 domain-containing protein [Bryobacteraceae bacterium]
MKSSSRFGVAGMSSSGAGRTLAAIAGVGMVLCAVCVMRVTALRAQDAGAGATPVTVWQDSIRLITYGEGAPDPVPQFSIYTPNSPNYPYPVRSRVSQEHGMESWRTLNLENEYLMCRILPDFGGHLYSCVDKRDKREMFYANPAIRKGLVGLRGAWAPLGIESNFPAAHARDSSSPVDFAWSADADGSGRVVLENTDRVSGMQWRVDYVLRPGRAALEQKVTLHNGSAARKPYLWWANADVELDDPATRFILPTRLVKEHGAGLVETWPVTSQGRDESAVAGHKNGAAWFAYKSREPFMAIYKPASRSGVAHYADAGTVTGKKTWLWGSQADEDVRRELTDNFNSCIELQAGLFVDQETYEFLEPQQTRTFTESWMPIRDLGGVSRATPQGIVNMQRLRSAAGQPEMVVELEAIEALRGATLRLLNGGQAAWETRVDVSPAASYAHTLENPVSEPYTFQVVDASGKVLIEHTENKYDAAAASEARVGPQPQPNWNAPLDTEAFALARGEYNELNSHWNFALRDYAEGLRRYPASVALRKAAGRLSVELQRYDEGADLLGRVRTESPADDEVAYLLGVAQMELGNAAEARTSFGAVSRGSTYAGAAAMRLASLAARDNDFSGALEILKPLLSGRDGAAPAGGMEAALLRRSGKIEEARKRLTYWRGVDPANSFLRFEQTRLGTDDAELWMHLAADAERVIDIADQYMSLGLYEDALAALDRKYPGAAEIPGTQKEPGAVTPADSPLISYYRAYCHKRLGQDGAADLRAAAAQSPRYAFPYRASSVDVLQSAAEANPGDALAHLLAGRFYMNALIEQAAIGEWELARKLNPRLPEVHRDLAKALREINKDTAGAMAAITEGLRADPANPELWAEMEATKNAAPPNAPAAPQRGSGKTGRRQ